ncbi:BglG family transcription antiterminator [Fictibacillus marinisediminis]|uniref:BglG family transcription antiterminator n=1 Tax=Fictibacillus marinisediminis TaxID=2878389 RepID=UPI00200590DB
MIERQNRLLSFLLKSGGSVSVDDIAAELDCSEKTIRNDCKVIDQWLKQASDVRLIRRRGVGVYLEGTASAISNLMDISKKEQAADTVMADSIRRMSIVRQLLLKNKDSTLQELAEKYYVSKTVVRHDIKQMGDWLKSFNLEMQLKQKVGLRVDGNEKNRRDALSRLTGMLIHAAEEEKNFVNQIFAPHEIDFVRSSLKKLEQQLCYSFTESALENLITHILISIKRVKTGSKITISPDEEERIKQTKEYPAVGAFLKDIEKAIAVKLPQEEAVYITIRVLGTKVYYHAKDRGKLEKELAGFDAAVLEFSKKLIEAVSEITDIDFTNDELLLAGLAGHLQTTFHRLDYALPFSNPMADEIKKMYMTMFEMIYYALPVVEQKLKKSLPEEEIAYLTLHFQASVERFKKKSARHLKVLVICTMGIGMSQLIVTKLERKFHSIEITGTASVSEAPVEIKEKKPDLVISTVPFSYQDVPVIVVSPLMTEEEEKEIEHWIQNGSQIDTHSSYPILKKLLHSELISVHSGEADPADILKSMVHQLEELGFVKDSYKESVLIREEQSSTAVGGGVAIPHGNPNLVKEAGIGMSVFRNPVKWGKERVSIVFLLAMSNEKRYLLKDLFKEISHLTENPSFIREVAEQETAENIYALF